MDKNSTSRRVFLANTAKTGLGITVGLTVGGSLIEACGQKTNAVASFVTGFKQEPLPYAYNALEKAIDAATMEIHYTKHAGTYSTNLQEAAKAESIDMANPLEDVLAKVSSYSPKVRNNGGGHYNHELFWKTMSPSSTEKPEGKLLSAIESSFNSFDSFKTQFTDAGKNRFGSGWAWLYLDADKKLQIGSTPNQDNPLMDVSEVKGFPLLGLDVWEHAYYLRYQNKRPDYINNWWKVVNWSYVQERYQSKA